MDHTIKKPQLFISHASSDADFANAVKREIEIVFAEGISVFSTSSPGAIAPGRDWLDDIEAKLASTQAVIAIVTPVSIERPWLWFELGATWAKGRSGACQIYPLCAAEIKLSELPPPLDRLQALSLGRAADLKILFEALIKQFGFGSISTFKSSNITARVPKYKDVKLAPTDVNDRSFYSGRYFGYSDAELSEVLEAQFITPQHDKHLSQGMLLHGREDLLHNGKLIQFRQVDEDLALPPGASRRLLVSVAENDQSCLDAGHAGSHDERCRYDRLRRSVTIEMTHYPR